MITIRRATAEDIPQMVDIGENFFSESNFLDGLTIDQEQGAYTFGYMIAAEDQEVLVAVEEDKLIGFIIFDVTRYYTKELISHLFLFYVLPAWRGTRVGLDLLQKAEAIATERGAKRIYCSSTAGFSDDGKMDQKLLDFYKRCGYAELGCFVMKGLGNV